MLHKLVFMFCFAVLIPLQTFAQKNWVPFLQQTKTDAVTNLTTSNNNTVSFTVQISGMETSQRTIGKIQYQDISIPGCEVMTKDGLPQVPVMTKLIAIPDCDNVSITVTPSNRFEFNGYNILPAPKLEGKKFSDGSDGFIEVYNENKNVYSTNSEFPGKFGEITNVGYVRDQKVAYVALYPVQFNPAGKKITAYTNFNITLSFVNPKSPVNKELGIFRNMMHHAALNYEPNGISAKTKLSGKIDNSSLSKVSPSNVLTGSVTRVTDLSTLVGANAIPVDYLIITHSSLFNSTYLTTLANHRRDYNGYDVAIVRVNDDIYNYKPGRPSYQSIRDFIADVYNDGTANHTGDGHLGYIVLVGDAFTDPPTQSVMVPATNAYFDHYVEVENRTFNLGKASDYYYACLTQSGGTYDDDQDVMYGRLSVGNETELSNVVNKITYYENSSSGSWLNNVTFVSHFPWFFSEYATCDNNFTQMAQIVPASGYISYAWRAFAADDEEAEGRWDFSHHAYTDISQAVAYVDDMWLRRYTSWAWNTWEYIPELGEWGAVGHQGGEYADPSNYCGATELDSWLYSKINTGQHIVVYEGHGAHGFMGGGEGTGRRIFRVNELGSNLNNTNKYPFIIAAACETGHFDSTSVDDLGSIDCLAEIAINLQNKGVIGFLGSARPSYASSFNYVDRYILDAFYNNLSHVMGEAVMESKLRLGSTDYHLLFRREYNLFGDPALNLCPTGYTITEDLTISGDNTISEDITIASGVTLTISAGSTLRFAEGASLIVNGNLNADGSGGDITFNFTSPSSNNGIKCYSGSEVNIEHAIIQNAVYGIYADNGSDVYIKNSELLNNTYGIYGYYYCDLKVTGNHIHNNTYGVQGAYGSTAKLYGNVIENNSSYGVIGYYGAIFQLGFPYNWSGYNTVRENGNYEIYSYNSNTDIDMYNASVHDDSGYEIVNSGTTSIYCLNSWFGSNGLSSSGTIVNVGQLGSEPAWEGVLDDDDSSVPKMGRSSEIPYKYQGYEGILALKNIINNNSKSVEEISHALADLYSVLRVDYRENKFGERNKFYDFLSEQILNKKDKSIITQAAKCQISWEILKKNYKNAIIHSNKLLKDCSNEDSLEILLSTAKLYSLVGEKDKVKMLTSEIKSKSGIKNQFVLDLIEILENSNDNLENGSQSGNEERIVDQKNETSLNEFSAIGNYPNPFNPTTTISYTLPEDGKVSIKVFDVLGREVATLINGFNSKGKQSVVWDGSNASSGIYFYTITFKNQTLNKKMLLIK